MYVIKVTNTNVSFHLTDDNRHPHPHRPPPPPTPRLQPNPSRQPTRVPPFRQLRSTTTHHLVAQTIAHLLYRPRADEGMCFRYFPASAVDCVGWRLGVAVDGRERGVADRVCHVCVPGDYECVAVL